MTAPAPKRILLTGAAGRLGHAATAALVTRGHFVRGFDRHPSPAATESILGDIGDPAALLHAARDTDAIIHLAATPDDADFLTSLLPNNIIPIHHILEAARAHRPQRLILASTGQLNWFQHFHGPFPIRVTDPLAPRYWYAVTKVFAEFAGKIYAETHGLDVVAARLGACPRDPAAAQSIAQSEIVRDVYLSPGDAGRFFAAAIEAPSGFGFQPVYVCSRWITRQIFDLEPALRLFGFSPQDTWPQDLPLGLLPPDSPAAPQQNTYQKSPQ